MSIDSFKAKFSSFARPTLYEVSIPGVLDENLKCLAKAAQIPAATLGVIEVPYLGRKIKVAGDRTFAEWTLTIQQDESFIIRKQLEDWGNLVNDHALNVGPNNDAAYKYDAIVKQLGHDHGVLAEYKLFGCWPLEIAAIELSFETNDAIVEYTVTLNFDYWTRTA